MEVSFLCLFREIEEGAKIACCRLILPWHVILRSKYECSEVRKEGSILIIFEEPIRVNGRGKSLKVHI